MLRCGGTGGGGGIPGFPASARAFRLPALFPLLLLLLAVVLMLGLAFTLPATPFAAPPSRLASPAFGEFPFLGEEEVVMAMLTTSTLLTLVD